MSTSATDPNDQSSASNLESATTDPASVEAAEAAAPLEAETEPVLDPLAAALADAAAWKDMALRSRAELDNFRKRMTEEMAQARKFANAGLLESLLPVLDNFHFGLQAAENDPAAQNLLIGLKMVADQLQNFLKDQGAEEITVGPGLPFDPALHEAMAQQPHAEIAEGQVIQVVRRGYRLRERLLRPASVIVSAGAAAPSA
jgi:molecular chaperone GrpE